MNFSSDFRRVSSELDSEENIYEIVRKYVIGSERLTSLENQKLFEFILKSRTHKSRLIRFSAEKYTPNEVLYLDQPTSFTGQVDRILKGQNIGHMGWTWNHKSLLYIENPTRGFDIDYNRLKNMKFSASGEDETLLAGRYLISQVKKVTEPGTEKHYGYKVPIYILKE